eukprot:TRINITY_DN502_c0_g1_i1.p1 TRINITY_DN502_c0_g1~~TRINITY_DN502_c0_g1_i1.p1  ORF type:complete len:506 (+),score=82.07 TRINITY_DN502_c0_g1_i1:199-1716(+)
MNELQKREEELNKLAISLRKKEEDLQKKELQLLQLEQKLKVASRQFSFRSNGTGNLERTNSNGNLGSRNIARDAGGVGKKDDLSTSKPFRLQPLNGTPPSPTLGPATPHTAALHHSSALNSSIKNRYHTRPEDTLSDAQKSEALKAYNLMDRDGNGVIDADELYEGLKLLYTDITRPEVNKLYLTIDANRSGFITFEEFLHAIMQYHWDIALLQAKAAPKESLTIMTHEWEIPFEELVLESKLGEGTYGIVYKGKWRATTVGIKVLKVEVLEGRQLADFRNEIGILCKLRHPNIMLFMGACTLKPPFCIITEYLAGGSIYESLHKRGARFDLKLVLHFAKQTALALNYIHLCNPPIIHRDCKSENLLLDAHLNIKIIDFGLSCVKSSNLREQVGSPLWMAPEVLKGEPYNEKCDVYSFAVCVWEFLTAAIPYEECTEMDELLDLVVVQQKRPRFPRGTPQELIDLLNQCWDPDSEKRLDFTKILDRLHTILTGMKSTNSASVANV